MSRRPLLALYALAHFWVDLSCAFLVFRTLADVEDLALCLLLYNFCAFALQMPLGLIADRLGRNGMVAAVGCLLVALAFGGPLPVLASVIAGTGNALFHLGGGIDILNVSEKRAAALGVFVSPGALGLYILVCGNQEISTAVTVTAQNIPAGTSVSPGTTVKLEFTDTKASD
jgi:FSR family fosmidomycin resistance protein-like MFS transporter